MFKDQSRKLPQTLRTIRIIYFNIKLVNLIKYLTFFETPNKNCILYPRIFTKYEYK